MESRGVTRKGAEEGFLGVLKDLRGGELFRGASSATSDEARRILHSSALRLKDAALLLRLPPGSLLEELVERARQTRRERFGRAVLLHGTCHLSNFCVNACRYCPLAAGPQAARRWCSPLRAEGQIARLAVRGFKRIVLVASESPSIASREYLLEVIERGKPYVPEIDLAVAPADETDYRLYARAGASGIVCHQETYDAAAYAFHHTRGPKTRFGYRLETLERAGRGGMARLGLGVLLGLADPFQDLLSIIAHGRYLADLFPGARLAVHLPRFRPRPPLIRPAFAISDEELLRACAVLRLALPEAGLVVSTRESEWLRSRLVMAGVTQMSVADPHAPCAFCECSHDDGPLDTKDARTASEVRWDLEDLGYTVPRATRGAA